MGKTATRPRKGRSGREGTRMRTGPGRSGPPHSPCCSRGPRALSAPEAAGACAEGTERPPQGRRRGHERGAPARPPRSILGRPRAVPASPLAAAAQRPAGSGPAAENGVRASLPRLAPRPAPPHNAARAVTSSARALTPSVARRAHTAAVPGRRAPSSRASGAPGTLPGTARTPSARPPAKGRLRGSRPSRGPEIRAPGTPQAPPFSAGHELHLWL